MQRSLSGQVSIFFFCPVRICLIVMNFVFSCCWKVLILYNFLLQVMSQAPGDEDSFCTTLSISIIPPFYPPNSVILMDSYSYINLIPVLDPNSGVWQQVDIDGRLGVNGGASRWQQVSSVACRQRMSSCHFNTDLPAQDNWLITQHIRRDGDIPQVSVQVEFELTGCEAGCQVSFLLEVWETSTIDRTQARNTSNYRRVQRVAPNSDSGLVSQNASIPVDFNTNETGFYLAFVDDNTCIAITRIIVFYYVCPAMTLDLVIYPEILSPPIDNSGPQSKTVAGQCVNGSSGELGRNPSLQCIQAGKWGALQEGTGCQCDSGFVAVEDIEECATCRAGLYVSPSNGSCQPCPANTRVDQKGVPICECLGGYFRADGESADFPCTQPPGEPTEIIVRREGTTAFLSWKAPVNTGGRTDIFYMLWFQPQGGERMAGNRVNVTMGIITDLQPNRRYRFFVSAENGVSSMPVLVLGLDEFSNDNTALIAGIVAAFVVVIVLSLIIFFTVFMFILYQRRRSGSDKFQVIESHAVIPIAIKGRRTYVDPLTYASVDDAIEEFAMEIEPKHLKLTTELGAGEFGTVYRAVWKDQAKKQVEVAVKTLKPGSSTKARSDFLNEASIMGQFTHDHVIKLYGVITKVDPAMIIMEFMENGSLYSHLRKNDEKLSTMRLLKMARGVCSGMEYLSTVGYVHRDLAARNVLLDRDEICKVADFGLSREVVDDEYNVQKGGKIPVRWTAPEAIYRRKFTSSSDVWSFGVLLWEVMSYAQHPYDEWDNQEVLDKLEEGYRLPCPYGCPSSVHEVMMDCWNRELSQRPSFSEVLKRLDLLLHTESPPKRPPKKNRNSGNPSTTNPLHCKNVEDWLTSVKMERYIPTFRDNGVSSVNQLVHLTESDLREMGITLAGHLHKLTSSIENGYVEMKRNSTVHN